MLIRKALGSDAAQVAAIYNHYIKQTHITFETEAVTEQDMAQRILDNPKLPWLVAEEQKILGYAYASHWKGRCAYQYSLEVTVYLAVEAQGKGVGTALYQHLFAQLKADGYHSLIAGIALPNAASIALHEKMGMQQVADFKEVGRKFERWIDVGYWQKLLGSDPE